MNPSDTDSNPHYLRGVVLALVTAVLWGVLPIFLRIALNELSPGTIAWFRFLFSFLLLYLLLALKGSQPTRILVRPPGLGLLAGVSLSANYFAVTEAIRLSSPSNVAILIQLAPVMLVIVGVLFFKERISRLQSLGFAVAAVGFVLFYRERQGQVQDLELYATAWFYILLGTSVWVLYISCQKILSRSFSAQSLNLLVYGTAAVALLPLVRWAEFAPLSLMGWTVLVFLGLNTLLAYGALAESVKYIPLTVISPLITLNPLITLAGMWVLPRFVPERLAAEVIGSWGYIGAVVAVAGVVLVVMKK